MVATRAMLARMREMESVYAALGQYERWERVRAIRVYLEYRLAR